MRFRSVIFCAAFILALATAGSCFWLAATVASPRASTTTASANTAVVRQFYAAVNQVLRTGDAKDLEWVVASNLVEHAVPRGLPPTRAGLEADLNALRATWPGIQLHLDQVIAQDDLVIARVRVVGASAGTFLGLPLPAPAAVWDTAEFFRLAGGQIIEQWGDPDRLALVESWQQTRLDLGLASGQVISLQRVTYDLAASSDGAAELGPQVLYVEAGTLTMTIAPSPETPATLSRAALADAAPAPAIVHPMVDTRLEVGDLVSVPEGVRYTLRNTGLTPATFLALAIQTGHEGRGSEGGERAPFPFAVAPGITVNDLAGDSLAVAIGPLGRAAIAFGRATLPPGAAFPSHVVPGAEMYAVTTGNVQLTLGSGFAVARQANGSVQSLAADSGPPAILSASDGVLVEAGATSTLANTGSEPATLLVVALRPGSYNPLPRQNPR